MGRTIMMYLTPFKAPDSVLPIVDQIASASTGSAKPLVNDLMFSGHTSTCMVCSLALRPRPWLRGLWFLITFLVAILVVVQHSHYTIDVAVAPFVVFTSWRIVVYWLHSHDEGAAINPERFT